MGKRKKLEKLASKKPASHERESLKPEVSANPLSTTTIVILAIFIAGIGFMIGYFARPENGINTLSPLRINDNFKYISPLLACDTEIELQSAKTKQLESKISDYSGQAKNNGIISDASVYIRDYEGGNVVDYNPNGKYNQASLSKVVVMVKILELASKDPSYLSKTFTYNDTRDYNEGLEIVPSKVMTAGNQYTIEEAVKLMIEYSDNNASNYLKSILDQSTYNNIYHDLKISPATSEQIQNYLDFRTAKEYSYFFRVLYNATYLNRESSEKAIEILSNSDFNDGLEAGVPADVTVAHKFGILNHLVDNKPERELHDCGIVYAKDRKPYLICVMTKSNSSLAKQESAIKDISRLAFDELRK